MRSAETVFIPSSNPESVNTDKFRESRNQVLDSISYTHSGQHIILSKLSNDGVTYEKTYMGTVGTNIQEGSAMIIQISASNSDGGALVTSPLLNSYVEEVGEGEKLLVLETANSRYHLIPQI